MKNNETVENQKNKKRPYSWKGFVVFFIAFLVVVGTQYPVTLAQSEIYLEIMGGSATYTANEFAALALVQPLLLGIIAIYAGHRFANRVNLRSLTNEWLGYPEVFRPNERLYILKDSVPFVVIFAVLLGVLNLGFDIVFQNWLPEIYQPTFVAPNIQQILANIFYGGFGQEILLRWGVMTTIIYVLSSQGRELSQVNYTVGIIFTSVLLAFAQFSSMTSLTELSFILILRVLLLHALDGILYGWLFYKFHFEAAVLCHMLVAFIIVGGNGLIAALV